MTPEEVQAMASELLTWKPETAITAVQWSDAAREVVQALATELESRQKAEGSFFVEELRAILEPAILQRTNGLLELKPGTELVSLGCHLGPTGPDRTLSVTVDARFQLRGVRK